MAKTPRAKANPPAAKPATEAPAKPAAQAPVETKADAPKPRPRFVEGIRITAKRNGFRRCGMAHSEAGRNHPLTDFTEEQLEALVNDPMLVCHPVEIEVEAES